MKPRAFTLVELLVVLTIVCLLAALMFPVYAQARRRSCFASATVSLRQIGVALHQYQSDNDGHIPIRNYGFSEVWETTDHPGLDASNDPLAPYGCSGISGGGIRQENNPYTCPCEGHRYFFRYVFSIRNDLDDAKRPDEVRRIEPQPTSVLVRCPNLLTKGYSSFSFPSSGMTFWTNPLDRQGRELLLHGDGSVSNIDTRAQRLFKRRPIDQVDHWTEVAPDDYSEGHPGQPFEVFPNEFWPPDWTTIRRPAEEVR